MMCELGEDKGVNFMFIELDENQDLHRISKKLR